MTLAQIKTELIHAHRTENWEEAKRLSQLKEKVKTMRRHCLDCGVPLSPRKHSIRCRLHATFHRFHGRAIASALLLMLGLAARAAAPTNTVPIALVWDDPGPTQTGLVYRVYWTTNITTPTNQWPLLALVTNPVSINSGKQLAYTNSFVPGVYFFTMTASNIWGAGSFFSSAAATPPPPPQLFNLGLLPGQ